MTEKEKEFFEKIFANKAPFPTILMIKEAVILEKFDPNTEQQIWQRVLARPEEDRQNDLRQLQREAMELAAVYRSLSGQLTGKAKEQANRLYLGEKANIAALGGIRILSRQKEETLKLWQPGKEPAVKVLQRCYHRARRCMAEYMARSAETEFGIVFQKLAQREGEHCALIAQMLGSIK